MQPRVYKVSFLYLIPALRSRGYGKRLLERLERYAVGKLGAVRLTLVVRSYNPGALKCYTACGFRQNNREGTLIYMSKAC